MLATRSLRFRMMALFCLVVGVLLGASYLTFYLLSKREIHAQLDRQLVESSSPVVADLVQDPDMADVSELNVPDEYFEVFNASGGIEARSRNLGEQPLALSVDAAHTTGTAFENVKDHERGRLRVIFVPFRTRTGQYVLALAMPTRDARRALATFRSMIFVLYPLSLLLVAAVSAWYVGRSLRPVAELTRQAEQMAGRAVGGNPGEPWRPLEVANPHDELGVLARTFNRLLGGMDAALRQLRQFVSDASHELRTPLAVLRGETELVLTEQREPEEYRRALRAIDDELRKLSRIVESLFTLSMADAGQLRLAKEPLYLDEVLQESCQLIAPLARAKSITIERMLKEGVAYLGDESFLRQLFLIFLDNAIKYSTPKTSIHVRLETADGHARVDFQDEGMGIAEKDLPHIFERFYRAAPPSSGEPQSGGLGLAIAQAIVRAEGGSINCQTEVGKGSTFTISLPVQGAEAAQTSHSVLVREA